MTGLGARLRAATDARGPLCVGIDPHAALLRTWGLPDTAAGAREFALAVVEAAAPRVGIIKPQAAFFERFGSAGIAVLEEVILAARSAGLLVIADAKRGDIGSTAEGYAAAWLASGAPLESDALTVAPYLGLGALDPLIRIAQESGNGVFALASTSNPEGVALQSARSTDGTTVAATIAREAAERNAAAAEAGEWGDVGVVIGATRSLAVSGIATACLAATPILAPGFGAQGAQLGDIAAIFGEAAATVIPSVSRSVLEAGRAGLAAAIDAHRAEVVA
ncbi:orotidine-5'-phosphate decarboxylase [Microcella alkalica]|uniref:Orotidine-5'-phosphate decarboxylase n=1 Tax=Microcella alkalica TaxID=355930 RepID=A0A839EBJ1_9MICO|nr:orotidine-5'-phosphate decarboxylase [Microcella alkalica]MBA8847078.1 orotidine-5'-phosphate decarboxylase [Microcella alkalica]